MLTPKIITLVYWLGLISIVVTAREYCLIAVQRPLPGLIYILIGALIVRIACEILIVLFKIHENLKILANRNP